MSRAITRFILQAKSATAAAWASLNPRLLFGRVYYDSTNRFVKIGDGTTHWNDAPYAFTGPTGATGPAGPPGTTAEQGDTDVPLSTYLKAEQIVPATSDPVIINDLFLNARPGEAFIVQVDGVLSCDNNNDGETFSAAFTAPTGAQLLPLPCTTFIPNVSPVSSWTVALASRSFAPDTDTPVLFSYKALFINGDTPGTLRFTLLPAIAPDGSTYTIAAGATMTSTAAA